MTGLESVPFLSKMNVMTALESLPVCRPIKFGFEEVKPLFLVTKEAVTWLLFTVRTVVCRFPIVTSVLQGL